MISVGVSSVTRDQVVGEARERDGEQEEQDRRYRIARVVEHRARVDLSRAVRLDDRAQHRDKSGVLLQAHECVQQRGNDRPHCLGQDDVAHRGTRAEPQ